MNETIDFSDMIAEELADYCITMLEQIQQEQNERVRKEVIKLYNEAAKEYNKNVQGRFEII